jgi:hypothetical protein
MTLIHNERIKLRANALNTAATSCFALGVLAPTAAAFYNVASDHVPVHIAVIGIVLWFEIAYYLQTGAQACLKGLRDD